MIRNFSTLNRCRRNMIQNLTKKKKNFLTTAYDGTMANIVEEANIDGILVGDSLGMVHNYNSTTLHVTVDEMIYHCKAVMNGTRKSLVIADMPFGSYEKNVDQAYDNAMRIIKETGVSSVKMEGSGICEQVYKLTQNGIPVVGHMGCTPQHYLSMGGFKRCKRDMNDLFNEAIALEEAGVSALVLECVDHEIAAAITSTINVPTIGIGSGDGTDGQIVVLHDLIGMSPSVPKFMTPKCDVRSMMIDALSKYSK